MERLCAIGLSLLLLNPVIVFGQWQIGQRLFAPTAPSSPAFGAEVYHLNELAAAIPTTIGPITAGVAVGQRAVVMIMLDDVTGTISSITDPRGNTYHQDSFFGTSCTNGNTDQWTYSANVTTALQSGDSFTITWSVNPNTSRFWDFDVVYLTGTASSGQPDSTTTCGSVNSFPPPITATQTTVATNTEILCNGWFNNATWTIGTGTIYRSTAGNVVYAYSDYAKSSAGTYAPGGTTTATQVNVGCTAYK